MGDFDNNKVNLKLLKTRAYNLRWATQPEGVIPLTAADPDFGVAQPIRDAIISYTKDGLFSYGPPEGIPEFRKACAKATSERKNYKCEPGQVLAVDSAAAGMMQVSKLIIKPGDEAIVFDPVDFLFKSSVEAAGGTVKLLSVDPLTGVFNLEALRTLITPKTKMICVCNPVNPVGRVLTYEELKAIGDFAIEHNLWIMNDEIWSDIVYDRSKFISLPSISPDIANRCFTIHGFSKAFGLAGLRVGFVICPTEKAFSDLLSSSMAQTTMTGVSTLSQIAATAAYTSCWDWVDNFLDHLRSNRDKGIAHFEQFDFLETFCPEGTYVLFPKIKSNLINTEEVCRRLITEHKVAIVPGSTRWFGDGANGHVRIVFSTSEDIFLEGIKRMTTGLSQIL